ncbi:MAG: ABC transporter permease, partial [Cytophagia bacterium]|nr:ABC transporter permease [Cytophagia bacterium]
MFKNYLKIAIRNIWTSKGYTFINVFGLAVGIACCVLISIYVIHELSYDDFHKDSENLYRVYVIGEINGQDVNYAVSMKPLGPAAKEKFPEVLNSVRIRPSQDRTILSFENVQFFEENVYYAGEEFFNIFSHNVLLGDVNSMLVAPNTIVLTNKLANKYFGDNDPIGKILTFN